MDPTIQLIQLMLRVEREAEAQRRPQVSYRDNFEDEKPLRPAKRDNRIKHIFDLPRRRQQGECASK